MNDVKPKVNYKNGPLLLVKKLYNLLAPRAHTVIIFGALFCTLAAKFFHAHRMNMLGEYIGWVLADITVLLTIEILLALLYFCWPRKWVFRCVTVIAALACTWSVMNAGWLIRTGTQILPTVIAPLFRDPINTLGVIGVNLVKMPLAAVLLLGPSAVALAFFFWVLAKPLPAAYNSKRFIYRITACALIVLASFLAANTFKNQGPSQIVSEPLRYNCLTRALAYFISPDYGWRAKDDLLTATRRVPAFDQLQIDRSSQNPAVNQNVIIIVLEGIQYRHTSLYDRKSNLTPYLETLAASGAEFTNARSSLTHTTKVLFSLLTGRFPSPSHDLVEAVPLEKPYCSLATILKSSLNFRTAFFQSAKGNFESRPGLVYNLGFEKFWARDDLDDPNAYLGYLAADEFAMLEPVVRWIKADTKPFLLTILCSVTHDPYQVPDWFAKPAKEPIERYNQTIFYTDKFIAELDARLNELDLIDNTIICVIGDHGEAFGEHGLLGHERIAFEEALSIPFCLRAPSLVKPGTVITSPVSSVDLMPTLFSLLGFNFDDIDFDGLNVLGPVPKDRKVYFSSWLNQSPIGFVKQNKKFIYYPTTKMVSVYDLRIDPLELFAGELPPRDARKIADEIITWKRENIFKLDRNRIGEKYLFQHWRCRWEDRIAWAKYFPEDKK
ncbi:MAG: LTA synthase family protein [Planctomycetota bacterium]